MSGEPKLRSNHTRNLAVFAAVLIASGIFMIGFASRNGFVVANGRQTTSTTPQAWPTPPPTFTPRSPTQPQNLLPQPTITPLPPPTWTELGYLASVRFNASTIVTEERQQLLGTDRLLLKVVGDVLMGVDLSQIKSEDVQIEGRKITLALPPASIASVELRLDKSQIYDSTSAWIWSDYSGLEKNAIENAQRQLYNEAASDQNMRATTELLAKLQLSEFLQKAGFKTVEITFKKQETRWDD